jgi:ABC-type bacteriocin/lantibiotic exporter with double-glycine peptidase domain
MGLVRVLPSIAALARAPLEIRNALPDASYLHVALRDGAAAARGGTVPFQNLRQAIRAERVSVDFGERGPALRELSVEIPRGSVCGFVGPSGSGKTTLLNVLIGVQPPSAGKVFYDSTDLAVLDHASLLRGVGYLGQEVLLFHGSIRDNISFFREDVSLERVRRAAQVAGIEAFIDALPERYDTHVGERGINVSGGQAQRIALARALIHDPEILVLDEPTSALDSFSEQSVLQALKAAARGRTVIMVTHRLGAVNWADTLHVLEAGRIVESGSWTDLTARPDGRFRAMCAEQRLL